MILAYLFFYHFSRQPSLFLRSSHRPLSLQPLSPPPQQSLCGVRSFLAPPGRWKSSARRERKKRAGGEGDCGERTASIRALEVSRAAKWAPRKGAPKGEAEEEEEEEEDDDDDDDEDEDKEEERKGGGVHNTILSCLLLQPSFASPTCLPAIF